MSNSEHAKKRKKPQCIAHVIRTKKKLIPFRKKKRSYKIQIVFKENKNKKRKRDLCIFSML